MPNTSNTAGMPFMSLDEVQAAMSAISRAADVLARAAHLLDGARRAGQPVGIADRSKAAQAARDAEVELRQMLDGTQQYRSEDEDADPSDHPAEFPRVRCA